MFCFGKIWIETITSYLIFRNSFDILNEGMIFENNYFSAIIGRFVFTRVKLLVNTLYLYDMLKLFH